MAWVPVATAKMARRLRDARDALSPLYQILIGAVVAAVLVGLYVGLFLQRPAPFIPQQAVETGDTVAIAYVGTFADSGKVFDTTYVRVAEDNVSYPKAASFQWRVVWSDFTFQVGSGSAIQGFDEGVRGMRVGESRRLVVPPEKGYGPLDSTLVFERPLLQEVIARETMNVTQFNARFLTVAQNGQVVMDPFWKWNVTVALTNNIVTITHSPSMRQGLQPYGAWDAVVESIDDSARSGLGIIYVRHLLRPEDAGTIKAVDSGKEFYVMSVDLEEGTYVANYNREVVGETLQFEITLVSITRR